MYPWMSGINPRQPLTGYSKKRSARRRQVSEGLNYLYNISTNPSVPFTRILCPSLISLVAFFTPTTAGKPYSRAITAPWVISPPTTIRNLLCYFLWDSDPKGFEVRVNSNQSEHVF